MSTGSEDLVCAEVSYLRSFVEELERRSMGFWLGVKFSRSQTVSSKKREGERIKSRYGSVWSLALELWGI